VPAENRLRGGQDQAATRQAAEQLVDRVGAQGEVIEQDHRPNLAEQLGALLRGGLERLGAGVAGLEQALQGVVQPLLAQPKVDPRACRVLAADGAGELAEQPGLAEPAWGDQLDRLARLGGQP
jgi:hypothetical protein